MRYVWVDGVGLVPEGERPKKVYPPAQLVRNVAGGEVRKTYVMREGKLVEITRADPEFCQRRPGRKLGMFVPRTLKVGNNQAVRIAPGKKTRDRIRKEGWRP